MKRLFAITLCIGLLAHGEILFAQELSSSNYTIKNYSIGTLETGTATSTNYIVGYGNDGTFVYDAPATSTATKHKIGTRFPRPTTTSETPSTQVDTLPAETNQTTPPVVPSVPPVYIPTFVPGASRDTAQDNTDGGSDIHATTTSDTVLVLSYKIHEAARAQTLQGSFSDGTVVMLTIDAYGLSVTDDAYFVINRLIMRDEILPYDTNLALVDQYAYYIEAVDATGAKLPAFDKQVQVRILYPSKRTPAGTAVYAYQSDPTVWQLLPDYSVGTNIISFTLSQPTLVGFWDTYGQPQKLFIDKQPESQNKEASIATTTNGGVFSLVHVSPGILIGIGGFVLIILSILSLVFFFLKKRRTYIQ